MHLWLNPLLKGLRNRQLIDQIAHAVRTNPGKEVVVEVPTKEMADAFLNDYKKYHPELRLPRMEVL